MSLDDPLSLQRPSACASSLSTLLRDSGPAPLTPSLEGAADVCGLGRRRGLRCFLVEDSEMIRLNLIATLDELVGVEVVGSAVSEGEALQWLERSDPATQADLLIIDIFLKSGSGLGVLGRAVQRRPSARRVVLTNFATADMRRRCLAMGADRVFDKSSELDDLLAYCESLGSEVR